MPSSSSLSILVFTKTAGYRHESISAGIEALKKFAAASDLITCDTTEDASVINLSSLSQYRVLVFLHTSGDFLDKAQLDALKGFIRNGGGFVGIHGAAAGMPQDEWYGRLVGAAFTEHPKPQDGVVKIEDTAHALTKGLSNQWKWHDEWYNFRSNPRDNVHVLMSIDESSYEGGTMGNDHPLAWCQEFEGARSFYTSLGHFDEAWRDERFHEHIKRGIYWAACLL
ncbi:glycosyl hydrolase [Truncatella angustata]|uniref:Glycosyl hydrolase n=1 Tax=Truncatella angustata TaxID=152316 RepID=A0A9P8RJ72_9PEZI|nr:glycosyl hydrolase [Truncatella angustata]KAH6647013.1 glycosyl hydrolase [Truncatella angustata]